MSYPTKGDAEANRVVYGAEFDALALRVAAGEARQRAAGMHDPDCAAHVLASSVNLAAIVDSSPRAVELRCTCWLSREAS